MTGATGRVLEVRYRPVGSVQWIDGPVVAAEDDGFEIDGLEDGAEYDLRVREVDVASGQAGLWRELQAVEAVTPASHVSKPEELRIVGDCLYWRSPDHLPERGIRYRVRWHRGNNLHWPTARPTEEAAATAPPVPLCGVPKDRVTILVVGEDADGNVSEVAAIQSDRGGSALEYLVEQFDHAGPTSAKAFTLGDILNGAKGASSTVRGETIPEADWPSFPVDLEPSFLPDDSPSFGDDDDPSFGFFAGDDAPSFEADDAPSFGPLFGPVLYHATFDPCKSWQFPHLFPGAVLTVDFSTVHPGTGDTTAPWVRLLYRQDFDASFDADAAPSFPGEDTDPSFPPAAQWREWPGVLHFDTPARCEFLIWLPGGTTQPVLSGFSLKVTTARRHEFHQNLSIPVGGLRVRATLPFVGLESVKVTPRQDSQGLGVQVVDLDPDAGPLVKLVRGDPAVDAAGSADVELVGW